MWVGVWVGGGVRVGRCVCVCINVKTGSYLGPFSLLQKFGDSIL